MSDSDDDDEMADLFSFSAASPAAQPSEKGDAIIMPKDESLLSPTDVASSSGDVPAADAPSDAGAKDAPMKETTAEKPIAADQEDLFGPQPVGRLRTDTSDSVLGLLDQDEPDLVVLSSSSPQDADDHDKAEADTAPIQSSDTQEILDWLDKPSTTAKEEVEQESSETEVPTADKVSPTDPPDVTDYTEAESETKSKDPLEDDKKPDPPELGSPFQTLEEAIASPISTMDQIRRLFIKSQFHLHPSIRPHLWCRSVCGKPLEQVLESSNADSYLKWNKEYMQHNTTHVEDRIHEWVVKESSILADRIVAVVDHHNKTQHDEQQQGDEQASTMTFDEAKQELTGLLLFHYQSSSNSTDKEVELDPLLPPVACALLTAGIPTAVASVMLSNIVPTFMPLLALGSKERLEASKPLHTQFYLLASYHLPLLVHHLDRYVPGWYFPKLSENSAYQDNATLRNRHLEAHGLVPQSWFISHLAGECDGTLMNPKWLVALWDLILISNNNSLRFFFSLALLEKNADTLLMATGDALKEELKRIMEFKEGTTLEGFAIEPEEESSCQEAVDWVQEWCDCARNLWESTPKSVTMRLRAAEDEAVSSALVQRQQAKEVALQERLDLEAKEHAQAVQAEKERRMNEARAKLTRARLVAYYRKYNPEKEDTVDKILKTFDGRLEVLDAKLKKKYGVGFNPALPPKKNKIETNSLLSNMNKSISVTKRLMADALTKRNSASQITGFEDSHHEVTVTVSPAEVLPVLCWSKRSGAESRGRMMMSQRQQRLRGSGRDDEEERIPIKFYLVDSRPADTCLEQGRFPTAANLSPETLLEPDRIQQLEDMFESLRGAVHICVMGEGFSAVPELYGQKVHSKLQELIEEDESRTSLCALFFVKKGFPFVSILDGGFAAAHAYLAREGPKQGLDPNTALVDYNANVSLFAQLEAAYREQKAMANASTREKTQHAMQNLFDGSLASLTKSQKRLEQMSFKIEQEKVRKSVSNIFAKKQPSTSEKPMPGTTRKPSVAPPSVKKMSSKKGVAESQLAATSSTNQGAGGRAEGRESSTAGEAAHGGTESSRFSFVGLAGSIKKDLESKGDKGGAGEGDANRFRNPFAKKNDDNDRIDAVGDTLPEKRISVSEEHSEPVDDPIVVDAPSPEVKKNRFSGMGFDVSSSSPTGKKNRFAGLGSALNNMATAHVGAGKDGNVTQPKRNNPFARFGGSAPSKQGTNVAVGSKTGGTASNRFANLGMSQLRKMRANPKTAVQDQDATGDDIVMVESNEGVEESISFFDEDDDDVEVVEIGAQATV